MRILQISNKSPYPEKDGGAIASMALIKGFSSLGHDVTALTMSTKKHPVSIGQISEEIKELADFIIVDVSAPISVIGALRNLLFSSLPYNAERFISNAFERELKHLLQTKTFDIIQLEGLYLCPYISVVREHSKALISYRAHNIEHEIWERTAKISSGLKSIYLSILSRRLKKFEKNILNTYDVLVPITNRDEKFLTELGNNKPSQVIQTGINVNDLESNPGEIEFPSIFHIGSLEWAPNQEGIIWFLKNCWGEILSKVPDVKFYIAGREAPEWFIKKLNYPNVEFLGEIDDAYKFIRSKSIMIIPLFSGSGMRIKLIESMALGKAVVSTTIGAEGVEVEQEKNILIADDVNSFSEKVIELANDKKRVEEIGANAKIFITKNFDNLAIAKKLIDFYEKNH